MSAIEWLHVINPFIITVLIITGMASLPITTAWCKQLQWAKKPLAFKKTLVSTIGAIAIGWWLAWLAPHIVTPVIRVNTMAASQLILVLAFILTGIIVIIRLVQRNNVLALLFILAGRCLPALITALGAIATALLVLFLDSAKDARKKQERLDKENSPYENPKHFTNYRGDYCDKNKRNWY